MVKAAAERGWIDGDAVARLKTPYRSVDVRVVGVVCGCDRIGIEVA